MRLRIHSFLLFFLWILTMTSSTAQNGQYDVRFTLKNFSCDSNKVTIAVQVRAHDRTRTFNMGDANYRFEYDPRLINTPKIVSQEHFSNLAPASDFNYGPQNLNGSSATATLGVVSLNTFYIGAASGARLVDTVWTTVSCIGFNLVNGTNCFPLDWHDDTTFPITGMNEVVLQNDGSYDLYIVEASGVFTNMQSCFLNSCGASSNPPTVAVTPIVTKQDSTVTVCMPINDPDSFSVFSTTICGTAKHGTATPSVSGSQLCVRYVPTPTFTGIDSVCITVCDNTNKCVDVKIPITVNGLPHPPTVTVTPIVTKQDSTVTVCMPINDPDSASTFTATLCNTPLHGTATPSVAGNQLCITYTPTANYAGTDSVCVRVCDNTGLCTTVNVPVTIHTRPHPPTVAVTPIVTKQDSTATVCMPITDPDSNATFTATVCGAAKHGTATPLVSGSQLCIRYVPTAAFVGSDSICITVCDNTNRCVDVKIPITINAVPHPPTVTVTPIVTKQDSTVTVCMPINDPDANATFNASLCGTPTGGSVSVSVVGSQLCIRFVPNGTYIGQTSVCVRICDDTGLCTETTVPIQINRRPTPPSIDQINPILTKEDSTVTVCLPFSDATPNAPYAASLCGQGAHGTALVAINGSFICVTYTPNRGYSGTDQVCIRVCETATGLCSNNALVPVTVTAKPHAPAVTATPIYTLKDSTATVCMTINDPDAGSTFTATLCNTPLHGTATPSVNGNQLCVKYVPTANYVGTDNICIRVCDNTGLCTNVNIPVTIDSTETRNSLYDVRITYKDVLCDSSKVNISVEVRAKSSTNTFLMGDANYRFKYDSRQIRNPKIVSQVNFSNLAPSGDLNYGAQNLNGSSAGTTAGLVSLNTYYTGVNQSAKKVDTAWQTVSCIQFDIVQMSECFDIRWNNGQTFPITGMSEVVVTNQNPFDYSVYVVREGAFTNLNLCPIRYCQTNEKPAFAIAPQTIKEDSSFRVCTPIVDPNVDNTHTVTVCKNPSNGTMTTEINNTTHQLCLNYRPNANYSGRDTVCLIICDNGIPSLCDTVVVPITIIPVPDTPSVPVSILYVSRDSTVKKCYPITDADLKDAFTVSICGVNHGEVLAKEVVGRTVCITYKANNRYTGPDTICMIVCDSFGLCRQVFIPIVISDCEDNAPPTITCPSPMRVNMFGDILNDPSRFLQNVRLGDSCSTVRMQFGMPAATDDCGVFSVSLISGLSSGTNFPLGVHNLVFEAMDKRGKTTSCSTRIEVVPARLITNVAADSVVLCLGSSVVYTARDLGGVSYNWQGPNGFASFNRSMSLTNLSSSQTGTYRLKVIKDFCTYEDAVHVGVIGKPALVADVYQMALGQTSISASSVLFNDTLLRGARYTVRVKNGVSVGSVSFNADGTFSFVPPLDFRGTATFVYEVCYTDCPAACQTTTVTIKSASNQRVNGNATNVITPNGDGINDHFIIENYDPTVDKGSQLTIYNQWGDVVFRATPYMNNWAGTYGAKDLPDGTYYFVFLKSPDSEAIKDFVTIIR